MKNVNEFIKHLVKIEPMESGEFGFYPFQMFIESKKEEFALAAVFGQGVNMCYHLLNKQIQKSPKRLYFALDFPPVDEVKTDFVCVFSYENKKIDAVLIPYDLKTGKQFDRVGEGNVIKKLLRDFSIAVNYRNVPVNAN